MCALPKGFDGFVVLDGTHAGKNPRRRELFEASTCGDSRCIASDSLRGWVEACITNGCEEVRHGR